MGSLYGNQTGRFSFLKMALRICGDYGYGYRMYTSADKRVCPKGTPYFLLKASTLLSRLWGKRYGVPMPDYLLFPDWSVPGMRDSYEAYKKHILTIWGNLPEGITETFVHPAVESDELKGITNAWQCRVWEYQLLKDPEMHQYLKDHGVELISYRELVKMKAKK